MTLIILTLFVSYFLGSIPTGYIFGRMLKGIDIRQHGSKNVGATNVFRVVGKGPGIIVLFLDGLKGFAAVALAAGFFYQPTAPINIEWFSIASALAVVAGHNWTVFLGFKGGKGVATSTGALIALMHQVAAACFVVWLLVFILTRIISISSIFASLALPVFTWVFNRPVELKILSVTLCIISIYKHIPNIKRLLKGEEKRIW
jgi:glycerol-3-phosphate acyltransferase PlsY